VPKNIKLKNICQKKNEKRSNKVLPKNKIEKDDEMQALQCVCI